MSCDHGVVIRMFFVKMQKEKKSSRTFLLHELLYPLLFIFSPVLINRQKLRPPSHGSSVLLLNDCSRQPPQFLESQDRESHKPDGTMPLRGSWKSPDYFMYFLSHFSHIAILRKRCKIGFLRLFTRSWVTKPEAPIYELKLS